VLREKGMGAARMLEKSSAISLGNSGKLGSRACQRSRGALLLHGTAE